jgi:hypothetical protein
MSDWTTYAAEMMNTRKKKALIYALNLDSPAARLDHYLTECHGGKFLVDELAVLLNIDESDVLDYVAERDYIYQNMFDIPGDEFYYFNMPPESHEETQEIPKCDPGHVFE